MQQSVAKFVAIIATSLVTLKAIAKRAGALRQSKGN
jgi:hypothetical protein